MRNLILKKALKLMAFLALLVVTAGCVSEDFDDLKVYISKVKAKSATAIEPMPVIKSYESYTYVSDGLRNPFEKENVPQYLDEMIAVEGPGPDLDREKEDLEAYSLDTLRMVGTLSRNDELWGLVRASDGVIHRVQAGQYLGQNYGKIMAIQEQQINLAEWVATTAGKWREREASLALVE